MLNLLSLPYEVLSNIVGNLDFDDYYSLGLTCTQLQFLLFEDGICKLVVQRKIAHSNEGTEAIKNHAGYSRSFRRVAKRHESLATANPFVVATIGFCDTFLYCKGVLCYTLDEWVRVIDLHSSAQHETVISIPGLLTEAIPEINDNSKGFFQVLYYSDNIISCLYKTSGPDSTAWLIAFRLQDRSILVAHELESVDKLFARHNDRFLYYGTHSELGTDGFKKWVIYGYEFEVHEWFKQRVHLPDMVGSEIGSTICFEFYDGFFYALSNQTSFEVEEIDWTSFYHCVRFPLNSPCKELLEQTENKSMWRRQHQEGPIDDRWTTLRLDVDEGSGDLKIVEARKEWYLGSSKSQRTYYTTNIIFPDLNKDEDLERAHLLAASAANSNFTLPTNSSWVPPATASEALASVSTSSSSSSSISSSSSATISAGSSAAAPERIDTTGLPDVQLTKLIQSDDHPHYLEVKPRLPYETHPGNDGSAQPTFTLAKSRIRTYHTFCNTFMDLVDDPLPSGWPELQRLRLRCGTRKLKPPLRDSEGLLCEAPKELRMALEQMYDVPPVKFWPAAQDPMEGCEDSELAEVYKLLNPPSHLGNVEGTADERSIVYATGGRDGPQALIFIGFDPAIKLQGFKTWTGVYRGWGFGENKTSKGIGENKRSKGIGEGPHIDGRAASGVVELNGDEECEGLRKGKGKEREWYKDVEEVDRTVVVDRKGKSKANASVYGNFNAPTVQVDAGYGDASATGSMKAGSSGRNGSWAWKERAMYLDINLGLNFGLEKRTA